jgi:hypothetical protein
MATREIEEADLLNLQHISGVVDQVMKTPETRAGFLQLAKRANPRLAIPEVDAAAPVIGAVHQIQKTVNDFIAAQAEKDRKAHEDAQVRGLQTAWERDEADLRREGWRDAGIVQVRKFAEDNAIANLRIAADAFERRNPQPGPVDSRVGWNLFTGPGAEDTFIKDQMMAMGEDDGRLDREIRETLAEVRSTY